jgi:hypothetical protein
MGERISAVPLPQAYTFSRAPRTSASGTFQQMTMRDKRRVGNTYLAPGERRAVGVTGAGRAPRPPADGELMTARS